MLQAGLRHLQLGAAVILSGVLMAGPSNSATKELTRALFSTIPFTEQQPSREMRRQFALAILAYWQDFDSRVPRLSPAEEEWIANEMQGALERMSRAMNTREFALRRLNSDTDECIETAQRLLETYEVEARRELEMYHWIQMVNCYDGSDDIQLYLRQAGISFNDDEGENIQVPHSTVMIQSFIVNKAATMAMAETMDWVVTPK